MFSFKIDQKITVELIQQHQKEELFELVDSNRQHLRPWLLWVDKRKTPDDFEPIIKMWIHNYAENNGFDAGIRYDGKLIGMVCLHFIDWKNSSTSIGYFLAENMQGKGIITKTVCVLLKYLFEEINLNRVEIQCAVNNEKSRTIPEKLGFQKEGIKRQGQWLYDHFEDLVTYSLLKSDWKKFK
ncbi:alanine acetyltransferase [Alkalihalobacillus alcalophilus ATCC 27647 = CGMCC 1.3604]|uniref:Alanine acetyltransferase n=1 Tax=Alkalihalobacillus alcalophilus ATCC 27647 = CGMCC 1.3604 TaxID=1218173 RepID=A0A094YXY4_ALKAL|nr:GNAT family protein [Alkalihalobacillus alcalophilus]KGA98397.1 alanine acetyltransferase [Alkalihalobacillus alcalophilus ATCC 27647 = CGMCC 1.3604]MED1563933.1 GNAT family protein [Alkalihalobacillus alcalophilus]THG91580.1 alanine acetyltransferase [Alkalihalobacillus alcalophilus ATCC 27647 = CGMCC 1.3604]